MLEGLMVLIAIAVLGVTLWSDAGSAKKKHSRYFQTVQKPTGKKEREAVVTGPQYEGFFSKLNSL